MSSDHTIVTPAGRPLSAGAIALMLLLCLSWGFNQIAMKLVIPDIPPIHAGRDPFRRRHCWCCC